MVVRREGSEYIFIGMHVDDFIVFSNSARLYKEVYEAYFSRVDGEDGPLDYYNGVNFEVDYTQQTIKLSSERTIDSIVQRYGTPLRQTTVPAVVESASLPEEPLPEVGSPLWEALRARAERYRSQVPAMLFATTTTRAECAWSMGVLCRCLDNPSEKHLDAADLLMAYMYHTKTAGVKYGGVKEQEGLNATYSPLKNELDSLTDSNWSTGRSISGFLIFLAGGPIAWCSKKQPVTSLSSTEAGSTTLRLRVAWTW